MKKCIPRKYLIYFAYLITAAFASCFLLLTLASHLEVSWFSFFSAVCVLAAICSLVLFIVQWKDDHETCERIFLLVAPPLLFLFAFLMMPFAVPDEFTHINRVFDNRSSDYLLVPAQFPGAFNWIVSYQDLWPLLTSTFDYGNLVETEYTAKAYSVVCYAIPALIVSAGRFFSLNGFALIYAARIANACVFLFAGYWILKRCPGAKPFLLVFLLNPMLLQQEASCSADVLTNIAAIGFVVQVLYIRFSKKKLDAKQCLVLGVLFLLVLVCKYAYLPLCLSAFLLVSLLNSRKVKISLFVVAALLAGLCFFAVSSIGYKEQFASLLDLGEWGTFVSSLDATLSLESGMLFWQFMGGNLGWPYMNLNYAPTTISVPYIWLLFSLLFIASFFASSGRGCIGLHLSDRALLIATSAAEMLVLFFALWAGSSTSQAVTWHQGRYFLPASLPMAVGLMPAALGSLSKVPVWFFGITAGLLDLASLVNVALFF